MSTHEKIRFNVRTWSYYLRFKDENDLKFIDKIVLFIIAIQKLFKDSFHDCFIIEILVINNLASSWIL